MTHLLGGLQERLLSHSQASCRSTGEQDGDTACLGTVLQAAHPTSPDRLPSLPAPAPTRLHGHWHASGRTQASSAWREAPPAGLRQVWPAAPSLPAPLQPLPYCPGDPARCRPPPHAALPSPVPCAGGGTRQRRPGTAAPRQRCARAAGSRLLLLPALEGGRADGELPVGDAPAAAAGLPVSRRNDGGACCRWLALRLHLPRLLLAVCC